MYRNIFHVDFPLGDASLTIELNHPWSYGIGITTRSYGHFRELSIYLLLLTITFKFFHPKIFDRAYYIENWWQFLIALFSGARIYGNKIAFSSEQFGEHFNWLLRGNIRSGLFYMPLYNEDPNRYDDEDEDEDE